MILNFVAHNSPHGLQLFLGIYKREFGFGDFQPKSAFYGISKVELPNQSVKQS